MNPATPNSPSACDSSEGGHKQARTGDFDVRARILFAATILSAMPLAAPGIAGAAPVTLPDVARSGDTDDGWRLSLSMTQIRINAVPNMAGTPFTGEGFVSAKVQVSVEGDGRVPINSGSIVVGVQLGCQVKLDEGLDLGVGNQVDVIADDPFLNLSPSIGVDLRPGYVRTLGLGAKSLKGRSGAISVQDAHVQIDGCGGPISVRLFASAQISSDTSDDSLNVYGEILPL